MKGKIFEIIKHVLHILADVSFWQHLPRNSVTFTLHVYHETREFSSFFILLIIFIIKQLIELFDTFPASHHVVVLLKKIWPKKLQAFIDNIVDRLDKPSGSSVKRTYLISLSVKNLMAKKTRTFITILGMSIGVGIIVLLLSLGYGVERLIINRIASLNELKMVDVATGSNTALRLNKDLVEKIKKMGDISSIMPLVSVVGKVDFHNAKTDVLVYATSETYLKHANVKLLRGKFFKSTIAELVDDKDVAGIATKIKEGKYGEQASRNVIHFSINPSLKTFAWSSCTNESDILGVVRPVEGGYSGNEYWGDLYAGGANQEGFDKKLDRKLQTWIKSEVPIFYETYDGRFLPQLGDNGRQIWKAVCLQKDEIIIQDTQVLGDTTTSEILSETSSASGSATIVTNETETTAAESASESASLVGEFIVATDEAGMEVVSFANPTTKKKQEIIRFKNNVRYEAVVSNAFLTLLNIPFSKALDTTFKTSFVLTKSLVPAIDGKASTEEKEYKIIGVIDDNDSSYFYIALDHAAALDIKNYSQLKLILSSQTAMPNIRKKIEVLGFRTSSTADTVSQIENLFSNLRILLALIGLVALGVASLGMFNTLTVSLLERTREIGGMKTIGMVSKEVRDLFLAEAMILGMSGGIGGLFFGFIIGKIISFLISLIAIANGDGYLELTYIPWFLVVFIIVVSFLVGILTGYYPARRAKRISALNALRYE